VTEQVGRIGVRLISSLGQVVELDAAFFQPVDDLPPPIRVGPFAAQFRRVAEQRADLVGGTVGELNDPQLVPVGIKLLNQVGGDFDLIAVKIEFPAFRRPVAIRRQRGGVFALFGFFLGRDDGLLAGRLAFLVDGFLGFDARIAIEFGVGEQPRRRAGIVEDAEEQLAVVVADADAPTDVCLNSVIELMMRSRTMFWTVGASTPVVSNWKVRMTGVRRSRS